MTTTYETAYPNGIQPLSQQHGTVTNQASWQPCRVGMPTYKTTTGTGQHRGYDEEILNNADFRERYIAQPKQTAKASRKQSTWDGEGGAPRPRPSAKITGSIQQTTESGTASGPAPPNYTTEIRMPTGFTVEEVDQDPKVVVVDAPYRSSPTDRDSTLRPGSLAYLLRQAPAEHLGMLQSTISRAVAKSSQPGYDEKWEWIAADVQTQLNSLGLELVSKTDKEESQSQVDRMKELEATVRRLRNDLDTSRRRECSLRAEADSYRFEGLLRTKMAHAALDRAYSETERSYRAEDALYQAQSELSKLATSQYHVSAY